MYHVIKGDLILEHYREFGEYFLIYIACVHLAYVSYTDVRVAFMMKKCCLLFSKRYLPPLNYGFAGK